MGEHLCPPGSLTVANERVISVMTVNTHGIRNEVPSPLDTGDAGLAVRRLAGLLGRGWNKHRIGFIVMVVRIMPESPAVNPH
jgi:hypothetical protein